jgi:hypothetical protein
MVHLRNAASGSVQIGSPPTRRNDRMSSCDTGSDGLVTLYTMPFFATIVSDHGLFVAGKRPPQCDVLATLVCAL